jgi:hypothetical protein
MFRKVPPVLYYSLYGQTHFVGAVAYNKQHDIRKVKKVTLFLRLIN